LANDIADDERLLRRVHPNHVDANGRVMWLAFRDPNLSVDRERFRPLTAVRSAFPNHTIARLVTGSCRDAGFLVEADPLPDNSAHALIRSAPASQGEARRLAQTLRDIVEWPAP
jgi:hypothetical protein